MPSVLLTAFEPYGSWPENSSWLTLVELTKGLPAEPRITTRRYPVELAGVRERLQRDLQGNYDYALHLGQAPGSACVLLEAVSLNVAPADGAGRSAPTLEPDGPVAYRTALPLEEWAEAIRRAGIPSRVSWHAGTHLCNATYYLSQYLADRLPLKTRSAFIHLPLELQQVLLSDEDVSAMPRGMLVAAVRTILDALARLPISAQV